MRKDMIDILACPIDKNYPLKLIEINLENKIFDDDNDDNDDTEEEVENKNKEYTIVKEGILYCDKCLRFYPIKEEIPILLPDELREEDKDLEFLKKWKDKIPDYILEKAEPWHL